MTIADDTPIYLETPALHRWILWIGDEPQRFERSMNLYSAIDVATAYLAIRHGLAVQFAIRHVELPRYYVCSRQPYTGQALPGEAERLFQG